MIKKHSILTTITILIVVSILYAYSKPTPRKDYKLWSISSLSKAIKKDGINQMIFMKEKSMKGTYIELSKGETFKNIPSTDAIYYIYSGKGMCKILNTEKKATKDHVFFVKKGTEIQIIKVQETLKIVKINILNSDKEVSNYKHFSKKEIEYSRHAKENIWNPFIAFPNVIFGMYMLPHNLDGDARLVHEWQELNIITSGSSKFVMDTNTISVKEGDIFFVEKGNGHYFDELSTDLDILILWEQ